MVDNWKSYCHAGDLNIEGNTVLVYLPGSRVQYVSVHDEPEVYRLTSIVARAAVIAKMSALPLRANMSGLPLRAWERNRGTDLVGFKIDARGRLVGEAWVPKAGLTGSEFTTYLHAVAAECDRFEYQLTGSDAS